MTACRRLKRTGLLLALLPWSGAGCQQLAPYQPDYQRPPVDGAAIELGSDVGLVDMEAPDLSSDSCPRREETLDGADDDCDGLIDEGFWVAHLAVPMATLELHHPGCVDGQAPFIVECMYAVHRYCVAQGYQAGYGPVEEPGSPGADAKVACAADLALVDAPMTALTGLRAGCTDASLMSEDCLFAIHRHCVAAGFATGFGPLAPIDSGNVRVACTDHVKAYSEIPDIFPTRHASCTVKSDGTLTFDAPCRAAISRDCQFKKAVTGYGPVGYYPGGTAQAELVETICLVAGS